MGVGRTDQKLWRANTAGALEVSVGAAAVKAVAATRVKRESLENMVGIWCRWVVDGVGDGI